MKTKKFFISARVIVFSVFVLSVMESCKKDEKADNPGVFSDYTGTWVTEKTFDLEDGSYVIRDVVVFTADHFTEVAKMKNPQGEWIDITGRKGTITANAGVFNVTLTEAGCTTYDEETSMPTGIINYYDAGTPEFNQVLTEMEMMQNYQALYAVSGNTLTLKTDDNQNGSYDDQDEVVVFTKQ